MICATCHQPRPQSFNNSPRCNDCQRKRTVTRNAGERFRGAYEPERHHASASCPGCEPGAAEMCELCADLWREANGFGAPMISASSWTRPSPRTTTPTYGPTFALAGASA